MSRLMMLVLIVAALSGCSVADGPYGYGYAVNERPTLAQLALSAGDRANLFRAGADTAGEVR